MITKKELKDMLFNTITTSITLIFMAKMLLEYQRSPIWWLFIVLGSMDLINGIYRWRKYR